MLSKKVSHATIFIDLRTLREQRSSRSEGTTIFYLQSRIVRCTIWSNLDGYKTSNIRFHDHFPFLGTTRKKMFCEKLTARQEYIPNCKPAMSPYELNLPTRYKESIDRLQSKREHNKTSMIKISNNNEIHSNFSLNVTTIVTIKLMKKS